jgi:putative MATE family efflux protein
VPARAASYRSILRLAAPALPALAAEPLYLLVDTAIVGHLGAAQVGALAISATLLTDTAWLCSFLAYGTTGVSARLFGAGRRPEAVQAGAQATVLAVLLGVLVTGLLELVAGPAADLIGDAPAQKAAAVVWLRVAALGAPAILVSLAGQGWMRGVQRTGSPLRYLLVANVVSAGACLGLVNGLGMGIVGSAWANVLGQSIAAALFLHALHREGVRWRLESEALRAQLLSARDLGIRTAAFQVTFLTAAAVASRMGTDRVAAHQVALQLWTFLALVLDSVAIAAQSLVGAALGAGDRAGAAAVARRLGEVGLVLGVLFAAGLLLAEAPVAATFTSDPAVRDQIAIAWPWLVASQPLGGLLFALDGVLIGAGDVAFMRNVTIIGALGGFLPLILLAGTFGWGLGGIWLGLLAFIVIRTVGGVARTARGDWGHLGVLSEH